MLSTQLIAFITTTLRGRLLPNTTLCKLSRACTPVVSHPKALPIVSIAAALCPCFRGVYVCVYLVDTNDTCIQYPCSPCTSPAGGSTTNSPNAAHAQVCTHTHTRTHTHTHTHKHTCIQTHMHSCTHVVTVLASPLQHAADICTGGVFPESSDPDHHESEQPSLSELRSKSSFVGCVLPRLSRPGM